MASNWWDGYPWRMIQTNLREIDMKDIDGAEYVRNLKEFNATVAMINTAGIIASYPTKLEFQFQSPYLTGDSLETIIEMCHAAEIRVVARTDFSKVRRPIYEKHPEWAYKTATGGIVDYNGDVHVCMNGEYQQVYALEIIREVLETLRIDGIFFNMGGYQVSDYSGTYYGICHCSACRRLFAEQFGSDLPVAEDDSDPVYRKYRVFKERTSTAYHRKLEQHIHSIRPDICVDRGYSLGSGFVRQESNTAIRRALPHWQYSGSDNTKWVVGSYPGFIASNTTVDFIDYPYRHVAVSPAQQSLRLAQSLANGGALDYYLIGRLDNHEDTTGYNDVRSVFEFHAEHEGFFRTLTSRARILLARPRAFDDAEYRGWFRILTENHFPFDTIVPGVLADADLSRYDLVVLPNAVFLSDAECNNVDRFVENGGALVSVYESGAGTAEYAYRDTNGLRALPVTRVLEKRDDMTSSYLKLTDDFPTRRLVGTSLVYLDGPYLYAEYDSGATLHARLIPPHMFGPPERCYYTEITGHPGVVVTPKGKGRVAYIPWLPGTLFHRQGYVNTPNFITDVLEGLLGIAPVGGTLSPMVEVNVLSASSSGAPGSGAATVVSLVNGSGHFGTTFYRPIPIASTTVEITTAAAPRSVRSLVHDCELTHDWSDGKLTVAVENLGLFEFVVIE